MEPGPFFIVINLTSSALLAELKFWHRLREKNWLPLDRNVGYLSNGCNVLAKFRSGDGRIIIDAEAKIVLHNGLAFLRSQPICSHLIKALKAPGTGWLLLFFEGTTKEARCILHTADAHFFSEVEQTNPAARLASYGLPPARAILIDAGNPVAAIHTYLSSRDPELFAVHAEAFLDAPHILVPLFEHVSRLSSESQVDFPVLLKKLGEQLRSLLTGDSTGSVRIMRLTRNHAEAWGQVRGDRIAFLDAGTARIRGLVESEPMAIRVGVYTVRPGLPDPSEREEWHLLPYVVGDLVESPPGSRSEESGPPDARRLLEAARYVLELLTATKYLKEKPDTRVFFIHGPLVNPFHMYDEGDPHYIPCLKPDFLETNSIHRHDVERLVTGIPSISGVSLWNHFMAVYGYLTRFLFNHDIPVVGAVERAGAHPLLTFSILDHLVEDGLITKSYAHKVQDILRRFHVTDDFLFGCVLQEGEYTTPIPVSKNSVHRARESWKTVVGQYAKPFAAALKVADSSFPFRVEMNEAAAIRHHPFVMQLLYHMSRLLPEYAFPAGLSVVDRYARIPDWLSRGISAQMSAEVLRKAVRTGDPNLVAQIRRLLTLTPRDFFYRPRS